LLLVTVIAVTLALVLTQKGQQTQPPPSPAPSSSGNLATQPQGAQDNGGILLGTDLVPGGPAPNADEVVTVRLVTDLLCPVCATFEEAHGADLANKARAGEIRLVIHPVANLVRFNQDYSTRSALALNTVAALDSEHFWDFYQLLWENRPAESDDGGDLTNQTIADLARSVGVNESTVSRLVDSPVAQWAAWSSGEGMKQIGGTPAVFMSGPKVEPVLWESWLVTGTDQNGKEQYYKGDLDAALTKVKAGQPPDGQ
jgi:protein-disulfide isomerase